MVRPTSRFGALVIALSYSRSPQCASRFSNRYVRRHASTLPQRKSERVTVRVGCSGNVNVDLTHPQSQDTAKRPSILVHIPPGPALASNHGSDSFTNASSLLPTLLPTSMVVTIDYRLSTPDVSAPITSSLESTYTYPQPVHDVSAAFSHILDEVIPSLLPPPNQYPHITLLGSHIGGSLASMLALSNPEQIGSVVAINPLVDWVILDELASARPDEEEGPSRKKSKQPDKPLIVAAAKKLIDMRTKMFRTPSAYFDPFASPTLFLRAPGRDTPRTYAEALGFVPEENEDDWISSDEHDTAHHALAESSRPDILDSPSAPSNNSPGSYGPYDDDHPFSTPPTSPNKPASTAIEPPPLRPIKRRKVLRRWPPNYSSSTIPPLLPRFHIYLAPPSPSPRSTSNPADQTRFEASRGLQALLHAQGTEFAELLKRACFFGRESGIAEERVTVRGMDLVQGLSWDEVGAWFRTRTDDQ